MKWISCTAPVVADVIRWKEPIWAPPHKKRGKPDKIGEQLLTAEVAAIGEFVELRVRAAEKLSLDQGAEKSALTVKEGDMIRRKQSTIDRGETERLLWSDEAARAALLG
jgi:hypothetical protein